jgi:hypothetical protein
MISLSSGTEEEVWNARGPEFKTEIVYKFFSFPVHHSIQTPKEIY